MQEWLARRHGTIANEITPGKSEAEMNVLREVIELIHAHEWRAEGWRAVREWCD
jgi:hypothetical protein